MVKAPSDVLAQIGYAHLADVMAVQARAYGPQFLEAPEVLGSKLRATGGTCWGAFAAGSLVESTSRDARGDVNARASAPTLCAYAIAHTVPQGAPLALNKVLAADIDPFCAAAVAANAQANGVEIAFTADNLLEAPPQAFDLICAGDVFYEGPMAEAMLAWLKQARAAGASVLVGDPGRTYFPKEGLSLLAEYRVPTTRELEDQEIKRTRVWSLDA